MYNAAVIDYKTLITQSIPETQLAPRDRSELIGLRYLTASGLLSRVIQGLKVTLVLPLNLSEDTNLSYNFCGLSGRIILELLVPTFRLFLSVDIDISVRSENSEALLPPSEAIVLR
jgi:hypothetical protein